MNFFQSLGMCLTLAAIADMAVAGGYNSVRLLNFIIGGILILAFSERG